MVHYNHLTMYVIAPRHNLLGHSIYTLVYKHHAFLPHMLAVLLVRVFMHERLIRKTETQSA